MKAITEKEYAGTVMGHQTMHSQKFQVEESDVGTRRANLIGRSDHSYPFKSQDVGRTIEVFTTGTGWTQWFFL